MSFVLTAGSFAAIEKDFCRSLREAPNNENNYNSGGNVAAETAKDVRRAQITVHHDEEHPSSLEIPIVK